VKPANRQEDARPSITLDIYGHLIPGVQREAADKLPEMITLAALELEEESEVSRK